jgi:hypothetical protein
MIPTKQMPGAWEAAGHRGNVSIHKNNTTDINSRQLVSIMLPWIAAVVTAFCSPSGKAGRFLDRLNVLADGGKHGS